MRAILCVLAILPCGMASAQTLRSFSAAYIYDPLDKGKAIPVVALTVNTFHDVFDHKGLDLDLKALASIGTNTRVGSALTYTWRRTIPFSTEFRPKVDLSLGPWLSYGTGNGKVSGGLFLGIGGNF